MSPLRVKRIIDRKLSSGIGEQLVVFIIIFVLSLLLVTFCYWLLGVGNGFVDSIAKSFADFFGGDQYTNYAYPDETASDIASWVKWVTLVTCIIGSIVFQGLLIATLTNAIQSRAEKVQEGNVRYNFKNHYLILGYNESVPTLVSRLCKARHDIVIVVSKEVLDCRNNIYDTIGKRGNVFVLRGDMNSSDDLRSLFVSCAKQVYILGEVSNPNQDLQNLDCYRTITHTINAKVDCYVQMYEQAIYDMVIHHGEDDIQHFHPYNHEELWARKVFVDTDNVYRKPDHRSDDDNMNTKPYKYVHFVIMGFSAMGEAMCREAALLLHYPNFAERGIKSKITCIDPNMELRMQSFIGRHKTLFDCCGYSFHAIDSFGSMTEKSLQPVIESDFLDIEFQFIEADLQNMALLQYLETWSNDDNQLLSIVICSDSDTYNYQLGHALPQSVCMRDVPVFMYQRKNYQDRGSHSMQNCIQTFGYEGIDVTTDSAEIEWGKYVNYIYNQLYGDGVVATGEEMNSAAEELWNNLSIDKRWSNIYNASSILYKLRGIGISSLQQLKVEQRRLEEKLDVLSEVEHNRWNVEQLIHGYRPTSPSEHQEILTNPSLKKTYKQSFIHDDIRHYGELDEYTKDKDRQLIKYLVRAILNKQ
jgi:hypothetical protein